MLSADTSTRPDRPPSLFRVLYRVFLQRSIDLEILASDGDPGRLRGQFAAVFFSLSFFCTIPVPFLIVGRRPIPVSGAYMFEHFLIETTMTIAGLIAVLGWDSTFPDRRDMLVLGPLPVGSATLFFSKIAATLATPSLAMAWFNFFAGFGWPLVFAVGVGSQFSLLRTFPAYWLTIFAAGAFFVFSLLAVQGLAVNLLPRQLFLRLSDALQAAALCLLLSVYFLGPSLNSPAALAAAQNQLMLKWLPAYWFLGLFNQLNGSMHPELVPLAHRAWIALAISTLGALTALLLCYFRTLPRIVEHPEILPAMRSHPFRFGSSLESVMTLFSLRTLLRSRRHRMILSVYFGLGLTIVIGFLHTGLAGTLHAPSGVNVAFLLASTLTMILAVLALRIVATIPISLPANWILRVTQLRPACHYQEAVRISWLALAVIPVLFASSVAFLSSSSWLQVSGHLLLLFLLGIVLTELCLFSFQKIPFACSYLPGKANLHFVFWVLLLIFLRLLLETARYEVRALQHLQSLAGLLLVLGGLAFAIWKRNTARAGETESLLFEEAAEIEIISLKLN